MADSDEVINQYEAAKAHRSVLLHCWAQKLSDNSNVFTSNTSERCTHLNIHAIAGTAALCVCSLKNEFSLIVTHNKQRRLIRDLCQRERGLARSHVGC